MFHKEDILLDLLSLVPSQDLVHNFQLVCSQRRDLVDVATLWKRKCQTEGYLPKGQDRSVPDFLRLLKRNLLKNHVAEASFEHWKIDCNIGYQWKIEDLPRAHGREFPHPHVRKYFVTSYPSCMKYQIIDLKKEGYWAELMDETKPDIVVKDWYAAQIDCSRQYRMAVRLLSADFIVLEEFDTDKVGIQLWCDGEWHEMTHTFHNYPSGVRYIYFQHGSQDTLHWGGRYGIRVTNSSITIGPEGASSGGEEAAPCRGVGGALDRSPPGTALSDLSCNWWAKPSPHPLSVCTPVVVSDVPCFLWSWQPPPLPPFHHSLSQSTCWLLNPTNA